MEKYDVKRAQRTLYATRRGKNVVVEVPPLQFLMADGHGDPNSAPAFGRITAALYALAYALKFDAKAEGQDFVVAPLEGLWWSDDMDVFTATSDKSSWSWTLMICVPEGITPEAVAAARATVAAKKDLPGIDDIRLETYDEGTCVQVMYVGPYSAKGPTIAALHTFAQEQGFALAGKHHEIYLSDPRRTAPERLRTVIRQPVRDES